MASIRLKFRADKLGKIWDEYLDAIHEKLTSSWPEIVEIVVADVISRAPEPGYEYEVIMYGEEGTPQPNVNPRPENSVRERFIREPGMWIVDAIRAEAEQFSDAEAHRLTIGYQPFLDNATQFSWRNANGETRVSGYGVYSLFEEGKEITVTPREGNYALSVTDDFRSKIYNKKYPAMDMYAGFNKVIFNNAVKERIRSVKTNP